LSVIISLSAATPAQWLLANHAAPFCWWMSQPDFVFVRHHCQVNGGVKPPLRFGQWKLIAFVYRAPEEFN
jgi:hypothetical protein